MQRNLYSLKREIVAVGKRVYDRGYVASNDGNISARLDDKHIVITPSGVSKGFMKPEDMAVVDMSGKMISGTKKPSSETEMHLKMYEERPDINSVCHAHPPYATGFAVAGLSLSECVLPEVVIALGQIPLVEYGLTGTSAIYEPVLKFIKEHDAFLLANHGALTIGKNVLNAYHKMETLEHFAHILFVSRTLGQVNILSRGDVDDLISLREKFGINITSKCDLEDVGGRTLAGSTGSTAAGTGNLDKEDLVRKITDAVLKRLG